jgi:ribosomal protein L32E
VNLVRYFQIRKAWDLSRYASLTEADLIFRNQTKTRFAGHRFEHLYRGWKVGRVSESKIRQDFGGNKRQVNVHFGAQVLCHLAVSEQEPEGTG